MEGFFEKVYNVVKDIPRGKVATYGQIAKILNAPKFSQIVGYALHGNPDPKTIPCHRVVNRFGKISTSFAFGGKFSQKQLLEEEGVVFVDDETVDLKQCQWIPEILDVDLKFE